MPIFCELGPVNINPNVNIEPTLGYSEKKKEDSNGDGVEDEQPVEGEKKEGEAPVDPLDDYPANPDDWVPPEGWTEISTGKPERHRHWEGPGGRWRGWDKEGRPGGKERGPHWHDSDVGEGETHIPPTR